MLERYGQLLDVQDPKAIVKAATKRGLKPHSAGRFNIYFSKDRATTQRIMAKTVAPRAQRSVKVGQRTKSQDSRNSDDLGLDIEKVKLRNFKTSFVRMAQNLSKTVQTMKQ